MEHLFDERTPVTVQMSLSLPAYLHVKLQDISDATGVPKAGIIQYYLERSSIDDICQAIHDMAEDGKYFPQMPRQTRATRKKQASVNAYLDALTMPTLKSSRLRSIDKALIEKSRADSPSDSYLGGNYV